MADALSNAPVESWDIDRLIPYEKNNKKHPQSQVDALAASIAETGLENPFLVEEDGTIISGHGRRLAVLKLGWSKVPVRVARGLTKDQARKLRIAVNKTTSQDYDVEALGFEINDLAALGIDISNIGLSDKEMTMLIEDIGEMDLDAISLDVTADVERQDEEVAETAAEIEGSTIPIAKAFGIKQIPVAGVRTITRFMGVIEQETGKDGLDALMSYMERVVDEAA